MTALVLLLALGVDYPTAAVYPVPSYAKAPAAPVVYYAPQSTACYWTPRGWVCPNTQPRRTRR